MSGESPFCAGPKNFLIVVKGWKKNFPKNKIESLAAELASQSIMRAKQKLFEEEYRILAVESQSLTVQGVRSGEVLTIVNQSPDIPLTPQDYPPGKLIALSDPLRRPAN